MNTACDYAAIPDDLRERDQWVAWRAVERGGRLTKVPVNVRNSREAETDNPATWATLEEAIPYARRHGIGVGFVFAAADPYAGVDLDDCYDPATGALADWARFICWHLASYTEVSPSGTGVKVIVRGTLPPGRRGWGGNGLYDRLRFFTVTGQRLGGYPATIEDRAGKLAELHRLLFPPPAPVAPSPSPVVTVPADLTDDEVIARASECANGAKFRRLWSGDISGYGSQSEADAALVALLHYWVGDDEARIDALFRRSGLVRGKWEERADYRRRTVNLARDGAVYAPREPLALATGAQRRHWGPQLSRMIAS
jgi:primase-polymerase (primpol)-like protein